MDSVHIFAYNAGADKKFWNKTDEKTVHSFTGLKKKFEPRVEIGKR